MKSILFTVLIIFSFFACSKQEKSNDQLIKEIMDTDLAFSDYSVKEGKNNAFIAYADQNAVLMRNKGMPLEGIDVIEKHIKAQLDTSYTLTWKPIFGSVSASGDLGYTYGIWDLKPKGDSVVYQGTYTTIWKRQADNTWKWILDTGNQGLK